MVAHSTRGVAGEGDLRAFSSLPKATSLILVRVGASRMTLLNSSEMHATLDSKIVLTSSFFLQLFEERPVWSRMALDSKVKVPQTLLRR